MQSEDNKPELKKKRKQYNCKRFLASSSKIALHIKYCFSFVDKAPNLAY